MGINVDKLRTEYFDEALQKIQDIIRILSVRSEAKPGSPFDEGTKKVLEYAIKLGTELGFKTYQDS